MNNLPRTPEEYRWWYAINLPDGVRWGECWCGCRATTSISLKTILSDLHFRGEPLRFKQRHKKALNERYLAEDRGYETPCWIWTGHIAKKSGYAVHKINRGRIKAHRFMYERVHGPVAPWPQTHLHHKCEVKSCVRPSHLIPLLCAEHSWTSQTTKLTPEDVGVILHRLAGGWRRSQIAHEFSVSVGTIHAIAQGKIWRKVKRCV